MNLTPDEGKLFYDLYAALLLFVNWKLEVNGLIMEMRHALREVQEMAFEKGLIPYIPADRAESSEKSPRKG